MYKIIQLLDTTFSSDRTPLVTRVHLLPRIINHVMLHEISPYVNVIQVATKYPRGNKAKVAAIKKCIT